MMISGSSAGGFLDFLQYDCALGIVGGASSGEHQLAIHIFLRELVSLYHSDRIFQAIEARYLGHDGTGAIDAEFVAHLLDLFFGSSLFFSESGSMQG